MTFFPTGNPPGLSSGYPPRLPLSGVSSGNPPEVPTEYPPRIPSKYPPVIHSGVLQEFLLDSSRTFFMESNGTFIWELFPGNEFILGIIHGFSLKPSRSIFWKFFRCSYRVSFNNFFREFSRCSFWESWRSSY